MNRILKNLDNPPRILFWELDEFTLMVSPFFIFLSLDLPLGMLLGLVIAPFYKKFKRKYPRGNFQHLIYWNMPSRVTGRLKRFPPSHIRELNL